MQFTYAVVSPIPKPLAGVRAEASEPIWRNVPPARVWVYRGRVTRRIIADRVVAGPVPAIVFSERAACYANGT